MFDFLDIFSLGQEIKAHGKDWILIKYLKEGYSLAVPKGETLPCQVYLIREDTEDSKEGANQ